MLEIGFGAAFQDRQAKRKSRKVSFSKTATKECKYVLKRARVNCVHVDTALLTSRKNYRLSISLFSCQMHDQPAMRTNKEAVELIKLRFSSNYSQCDGQIFY